MLASPALDERLDPADVPRQRAAADVADLAIAGLYIPAGKGPEPVAGDFFDVVRLDDELVALLVGDVSGHGTHALAAMRRLRAEARACARQQSGPAAVLARLDDFLDRAGADEFATVWYGEYRSSSGTLTYASAGHPPPALYVDRSVRLLAEADAPLLGTGVAHANAVDRTVSLPPGAILIAYSDGLIERRGTDIDDQLALLASVVEAVCDPAIARTPESIAAEVLDALVPDPGRAEDDVCVLVVRRAGPVLQMPS